jgi:hypothetical protein
MTFPVSRARQPVFGNDLDDQTVAPRQRAEQQERAPVIDLGIERGHRTTPKGVCHLCAS